VRTLRLLFAISSLIGMSLSGTLAPAAQAHPAAQAGGCQTFPVTQHTVCGLFLAYWQSHGGLAQQGYPIGEETQEVSALDGKLYTVQYFERSVLEKHPEKAPPFDVLPTQLGTIRYQQKYPNGAPGQHAVPGSPLFPATGHHVGGPFLAYWQSHGALAQQGYPISEEFTEVSALDGKPYTVQYFERAVFEWHPENSTPYKVLLAQLGTLRQREIGLLGNVSRPAAPGARLKGLNYAAWYAGQYATPEADQSLANLAATGANTLALVVTGYQDTLTSTQIIWTTPRTPTDGDLAHVIAQAHARGLQVMLKPHVDVALDGAPWRGQIGPAFSSPDQWNAWFASYQAFIDHYAALAQQQGVDLFCVGTELLGTSGHDANWRAIIGGIRGLFHGPLTYASNWGGEETGITWWDAVDYIGVDAYYPLTGKPDPSVDELQHAWVDRGYFTTLSGLAARFGKPLLFTEIGYGSVVGANQDPVGTQNQAVDLPEQAHAYQAAFGVFWNQPWFAGMYWWSWDINPNRGGSGDPSFTPYDKPAEQVLQTYYGAH